MITRNILLALVWFAAASFSQAAATRVGEVSLVIGEARLAGADGEVRLVTRNAPIQAGDRIETSAGGHVHIRFVDGGMVSVRPESRLIIESYQREANGVPGAAIKFRLDHGAVRSVTGEWGEASRERFRLNTPIAAIGVRGTDFVVQADRELVRAAVVSGAIVVAPYGEGCRAELLGPCSTGQAATLAADMGKMMVELRRLESVPRIVPLTNLQVSTPSSLRANEPVRGRLASETQDAVAETSVSRSLQDNPVVLPVVQPVQPAQPEELPKPPPVLLAWGRWGTSIRPGDTITMTQAEARADGARQIAIGSSDSYYLLYRTDGANASFPASIGNVEFNFSSGLAHLNQSGQMLPVAVQGGGLGVNFATGTFVTHLGLSQQQLGNFSLDAQGKVERNGIFLYRGMDGGYVSGAVSTDASQAGYAFGQPTRQGLVSGIANWTVRK
jgi:hypothetical protein